MNTETARRTHHPVAEMVSAAFRSLRVGDEVAVRPGDVENGWDDPPPGDDGDPVPIGSPRAHHHDVRRLGPDEAGSGAESTSPIREDAAVPTIEQLQPELTEITDGLDFPEGPIALPDGSIVLVEMLGERLTRVRPDGSKETVAEVPGGPNGAAVGPDGEFYVCNNGRAFTRQEFMGLTLPGRFDPTRYIGGRIQRVDPDGTITDLYTECDGRPLRAPNDLVLDGHGGMWFTDHGIRDRVARTSDLTGIHHARLDGSSITEAVFPTESPNGIGLSPDGERVYWAETHTARLHQRVITGPGQVAKPGLLDPASILFSAPDHHLYDSLAVDAEGWVCVATIAHGGVTAVSPDGARVEHHLTDDPLTTNVCFAGSAGDRVAYLTLSATGRLVRIPWPR